MSISLYSQLNNLSKQSLKKGLPDEFETIFVFRVNMI